MFRVLIAILVCIGLNLTVTNKASAEYSYSCRSVEGQVGRIQRSIDRISERAADVSARYYESISKANYTLDLNVSKLISTRESNLYSCERQLDNVTYNNFLCLPCIIRARIRYELCRDNAFRRADIRYGSILNSHNNKINTITSRYSLEQSAISGKLAREQSRLEAAMAELARCRQCNFSC